jgi:uncharacterized protein (TIGR02246 family)
MKPLFQVCLLMALPLLATSAGAQPARPPAASTAHENDVEAVRKAIAAMGEAFNAKNPAALMALHAPDVILTDPGLPDQTFETLAKSYGELNKMKPGVTVTTSPTIEEILLSGDLAVVRIIWTTLTVQENPQRKSTRFMKGLQVWRRESDGSWKFARGMNFRTAPPGKLRPLPPS